MKKFQNFLIVFFSLCFVFPFNVTGQTYTMEETDGVKHIRNHDPLWGGRPKTALEFVQKIGVIEGPDENYMLYRPNDVVVDSEGNIYISDMGNYRIQKFSAKGQYLSTIGRKGQGPGEFSHFVRCMDIDGETLIINHTNFIIHRISTSGEDIGRYTASFAPNFIRHLSTGELLTKGGIKFIGRGGNYTYESSETALVRIFSKENKSEIRLFGSPVFPKEAYEAEAINGLFAEPGENNNIYVAFEHRNRLEKYSYNGELLLVSSRPLNFKETLQAEWVHVPSRKTSPLPGYNIVSRGMAVDSKNRIWILTPNRRIFCYNADEKDYPAEKNKFDFHIFNADGIFLGSVPVPVTWFDMHMRIFGNRLLLIESKKEMCVFEYEIKEK